MALGVTPEAEPERAESILIPKPERIWQEQYETLWMQYGAVSLINPVKHYEQYEPYC